MTSNRSKEWEKEFDKKFVVYTGTKRIGRVGYFTTPHDDFAVGHDPKLIKSFIHSILSQQRTELIEKVKEYFGHIGNDGSGKPMNIPQNEIANDVLQLIKGDL